MKFVSKNNVKLVDVRQFTSKTGNPCTFLTIADPVTYESGDFMPVTGLDVSSLRVGGDYIAEIVVQGRYHNVSLLPVK